MIHTYADKGWHVFPLKPRSKHPITQHGCLDATNSHDQIAAWIAKWPNANWGIATGPSRLLVVDLDGDTGIQTWTELESLHRPAPTLVSFTGGGGRHLLYHDTDGIARNTAGQLGPSIDTRGRGGYIVAPPSFHPNSQPYTWGTGTLTSIPNWLRQLLTPSPPTVPRVAAAPAALCDRYGETVLDSITRELQTATQGHRNDALNRVAYTAGKLVRDGHAPPHAVAHLRDIAIHLGLRPTEADATWRSGYTAGLIAP